LEKGAVLAPFYKIGCEGHRRAALMAAVKDGPILRLAGRQHGLVTTQQLIALGYSKSSLRRRLEAGVLFRVYRSVYAVAGTKDTFDFRVMAAVLAAGEGALASPRCAAALFGLRRIRCDQPELTVSGRAAPRIGGLEAHRRDVLVAVDRTKIGVIPVTAPPWTLLDLAAGDLEPVRVGGALDDVLMRKLASLGAIERLLARAVPLRLPGAGLLADLVDERRRGKKPSGTGGTARFDAAYPELRLGFEADGDAWHKGLLDQMRDEARDEQCGLVGWTVRRYGTEDIRERPAGIADEVLRLHRMADAA